MFPITSARGIIHIISLLSPLIFLSNVSSADETVGFGERCTTPQRKLRAVKIQQRQSPILKVQVHSDNHAKLQNLFNKLQSNRDDNHVTDEKVGNVNIKYFAEEQLEQAADISPLKQRDSYDEPNYLTDDETRAGSSQSDFDDNFEQRPMHPSLSRSLYNGENFEARFASNAAKMEDLTTNSSQDYTPSPQNSSPFVQMSLADPISEELTTNGDAATFTTLPPDVTPTTSSTDSTVSDTFKLISLTQNQKSTEETNRNADETGSDTQPQQETLTTVMMSQTETTTSISREFSSQLMTDGISSSTWMGQDGTTSQIINTTPMELVTSPKMMETTAQTVSQAGVTASGESSSYTSNEAVLSSTTQSMGTDQFSSASQITTTIPTTSHMQDDPETTTSPMPDLASITTTESIMGTTQVQMSTSPNSLSTFVPETLSTTLPSITTNTNRAEQDSVSTTRVMETTTFFSPSSTISSTSESDSSDSSPETSLSAKSTTTPLAPATTNSQNTDKSTTDSSITHDNNINPTQLTTSSEIVPDQKTNSDHDDMSTTRMSIITTWQSSSPHAASHAPETSTLNPPQFYCNVAQWLHCDTTNFTCKCGEGMRYDEEMATCVSEVGKECQNGGESKNSTKSCIHTISQLQACHLILYKIQ
ncbi:flocculation protein FLO11 isoform X2 [Folsomia candida]|uniref:flocculation protein FLO11 isoform X2 n=1 Tax=Folsomia candida TaxID=158441 RepID=UPI0016053C9F|nr:flocculation protein FLO11 isoform X2 [Folsomia candida]